MTASPEKVAPELQEYVRVLRSRKFEVGAVTVGIVVLTMFFTLRQTPVYEGLAQVWVKPQVNPSSTVSIPQQPNLDTERVLLLSDSVTRLVQQRLHLTTSVETLRQHLKVEVVTDTEVLIVKYDDPNAVTAARLANGFADGYVLFRSREASAQFQAAAAAVQEQIRGIRSQLNDLEAQIQRTSDLRVRDQLQSERDPLVAQLGVLQQRLQDLTANAGVAATSAEIVERAGVPTSPVSPNKVRNGILALVVGLALGVALAFLRDRLDDEVRTRHELEQRLGAPVLAAVPRVPGWRRADVPQLIMRSDPNTAAGEAYRTLGTNIQYLASQAPLKAIMVTSAIGGDGKTTTSANLAVVLARAGERVILMSADVRRPRLHRFFGLPNDRGLSDLLANKAATMQVEEVGIPNLRLLNAGRVPSDPAALLGNGRIFDVLNELRDVADFLIIDTPPVLAVADTLALAPAVDGGIFVVNAGAASRSALRQAREQLDNVGARILGVVYNNFNPGSSSIYTYYHGYYEHYYGNTDGSSNGAGSSTRGRRLRAKPSPFRTLAD